MQPVPAPTAVVADDERLMREQIIDRLKEAWPELLIVGEAGNGREAVAIVQSLEPDIVFLDISMPGMDGIQAAQALAGQAHVVFVTAHDEYAISAFEQGAVDYLLKPAEPERVALTCQRLRERLRQEPDPMDDLLAQLSQRLGAGGVKPREYLRWVQASVGANIRMIPTSDILFFRAEDKYTRVQTRGFEALIRKPIKELIEELDPDEFWQIHRATVVRVDAVEQVSRNFRGNQVVHVKGSDGKARSEPHLQSPVQADVERRFVADARKVIITCAITGSIHTPSMSPHLPVTPAEIADAAVAAAEAGAAIVHLHARDPVDGRPTQDPRYFREFAPDIKRRSNVVINFTTGGAATMTIEERLQPALQLKPEVASLNMGSMNFGLYPMLKRYPEFKYPWEREYLAGSEDRVFKQHVQGHRLHPDLVRRERHALRDRVLRHRPPVLGRAFPRPGAGAAATVHPKRIRDPGWHRWRIRMTSIT